MHSEHVVHRGIFAELLHSWTRYKLVSPIVISKILFNLLAKVCVLEFLKLDIDQFAL